MEKLAAFILVVLCCTFVEVQTATPAPTTIATNTTTAAAATTNAANTTAAASATTAAGAAATTAAANTTAAGAAATTAAANTTAAAATTAAGAAATTEAANTTGAAATTAAGAAATTAAGAAATTAAGAAATTAAVNTTAAAATTAATNTTAAAATTKQTTVMASTTPIITTTEVDLCLTTSNPCQNGGNCSRVPGGYMCNCTGTGYMGKNCTEDVDECDSGDHMCDGNATCTNTEGSYTCACNDGYRGDGMNCTDINECKEMHNCHPMATCHNVPGSFHCDCNEGQKGNGTFCEDVDECAFGIDACHEHANCSNTDGNYTCTCIAGHIGDGFNCTDVDECSTDTDDCHDHANCVNTEGSFICECKDGYTRNGTECVDVDECFLGSDTCQFFCDNTEGTYTCRCPDGYILQSDNSTCMLNASFTCGATCNDPAYCVVGNSSTCACPPGYMLESGVNCEDIDECSNSTLNNCDPLSGTCVNTDGGYSCECDAGFTLQADGTTCQDNNECTDLCKNGDCVNTPGSFNCTCHAGYKYNPTTQNCEDVNECEEQTVTCGENQKCENLVGNFTCQCLQGFYLKGQDCFKATKTFAGQIEFEDTFTDKLADPGTTAFRDMANRVETELDKVFRPRHPTTFEGVQVTALSPGSVVADYDLLFAVSPGEADTSLTSAHLNTELQNTLEQSCATNAGGERICELGALSGVPLAKAGIEDLNECASSESYQCPANTDCVNIDGGYRCVCSDGFQVDPDVPSIDGKEFCTALDSCRPNPCQGNTYCSLKDDGTHECKDCPCLNGGVCVSTTTSNNYYFSCRCPGGYSGDDCGSQTVFFITTIACAAGAGLFLIILIIVAVCTCCRRNHSKKELGFNHDMVEMQPNVYSENTEHRLSGDQASGVATTFGSGHANKAATGDDGKELDMDYF
ncbi:uncharacterized protein LOC144906165 isoform X2 [Branchiostoma floridae x Branchiostoma belcheri]